MLSPELRTALIDALVDPAKSQTDFAKLSKSREVAYAETAGAITYVHHGGHDVGGSRP